MATQISTLSLSSEAFRPGKPLSVKYTCDGENISPPLEIGVLPDGTASLVVILDDPDAPAGNFTHWLVFNISPDIRQIRENVGVQELGTRAALGRTDGGQAGYFGPCPPPGRPHHYVLRGYALDRFLELRTGVK